MGDIKKSTYTKKKRDDDLYPYFVQSYQTTILYTYYVAASITVVVLAISLLWLPICLLLQELSTVVSRTLIYANKELMGTRFQKFVDATTNFISSPILLVVLALFIFMYVFYAVAADILVFVGCYIKSWPDKKFITSIKRVLLSTIDFLLRVTGWKELSFTKATQICLQGRLDSNTVFEKVKIDKAEDKAKNKVKRRRERCKQSSSDENNSQEPHKVPP